MANSSVVEPGTRQQKSDEAPPPDLYVGQFLLGNRKIDFQSHWCTYLVAGLLTLSAHPDLSVFQVNSEDKRRQLTLVGELMDPRSPELDNESILLRLLGRFASRGDLVKATASLGGRWILIGMNGDDVFLFHDALGLRQVFHSDVRLTEDLWVMSQPGIGFDALGFGIDAEARAFIDSFAFRSDAEYRWPGAASPARELKRLLPNHSLDLRTGEAERYWPVGPLQRIPAADAVDTLAVLLPGLVQAVARRHRIALSLTAGIDSRLMLAAARELTDRIDCVTVRQAKMPDDHADIVVPAALLARLNLRHQIIRAPAAMSADFSRYFKRNVFLAHDHYGPDAEAARLYNNGTRVALTGSGAEVGRCPFRNDISNPDRKHIRAHELARLQRMGIEPFAVKSFESWLMDAQERYDMKLLDLFDWEQGHGSWLAMTQLEFDTAWRDIFTPYNSREILTTLLGVEESQRCSPNYRIFRTLIARLWPELLQVPINPISYGDRARNMVRKLLLQARLR